jgi:RHS repeat-associated protein
MRRSVLRFPVPRSISVAVGVALVAASLIAAPRTVAQEAEPTPEATDDAAADQGPPVEIPPPSDADRIPVPAPVNYNGVLDPELAAPDFGEGASPEAIFSDETAKPAQGDVDVDVYAPEPGVGGHLAVVSAGVFNAESANGKWLDAALTDDGDGWSFSGEGFAVRFPATLGPETPVVYERDGLTIATVPDDVKASAGIASGLEVRYADALPGADLLYTVTPDGYKERVLLSEEASPALSWTLFGEGVVVEPTDGGGLAVLSAGSEVTRIPAPFADDSSVPPSSWYGSYDLEKLDEGAYRLSMTLDANYLAAAVYPVTVDPGTAQPVVSKDAYVDANQPNQAHNGSTLRTGAVGSYRTFIRFGDAWKSPNRLIYSAQVWLKNITEGNASADIEAQRIDGVAWDETTLTWNNQPNTNTWPAPQTAGGPTGGWFTIQMKGMFQRFNDGEFNDQGIRIHSSDAKTFHSNGATNSSDRPYMLITYNDLPGVPSVQGPVSGTTFETNTPTLSLNSIPSDPNGDEVLVRYQVTDTQGVWTGAALQQSAWTDERTFDIPSGWLADGGTYWWRVQSADICTQPATLCDNTDGTGATRAWNASAERTLTIFKRNYGENEKYAMWSEGIGNGMTLNVNESNGNLFLRVPIDRLKTQLGMLGIGLSYNSQAAEQGTDKGLSPGWRLWAGSESSGARIPVEIEELTPSPYAGVKVTFAGGGNEIYGWRGGNSYHNIGAGAAEVRQNPITDGWTYRGPDGDVYTFDVDGKLLKAKPVTTKGKVSGVTNPNYRYTFDTNLHLTQVKDPLDRQVDFTWGPVGGSTRLTAIEIWGGHDFALAYSGGRLATVTTPAGEVLRFFYETNACHGGTPLMSEIRNGEQTAQLPGWRIEHFFDTAPTNTDFEVCRVRKLFPVQASGGNRHWYFDYGSQFSGTNATTTKVTDPRGTAGSSQYSDDFMTIVEFNRSGWPIQIEAPKADPTTEDDWVTTMVWDSDGRLLCSRSPQANILDDTKCDGATTSHQYNTEYIYDSVEPRYLLESRTPAAENGGPRLITTNFYDEGYEGLWVQLYENANLSGAPDTEAKWHYLNQTWGAGKPAGIDDGDTWSARLSGFLNITAAQAKKYEFKITSNDGVTLVVGTDVLLSCFDGGSHSGVNCGQSGTISKKLWPGKRPIVVEYQDISGDANLKVEWKPVGGSWEVIPAANLLPNLGLRTRTVTDPDTSGTDFKLETEWGYPGDDDKARRLPAWRERRDLSSYDGLDDTRRTEWTYDGWGRRTEIVRFEGTAQEAITTKTFDGECLESVTDPEDAVTDYVCNAWGDVTNTTLNVGTVVEDNVTLQTSEARLAETTYDAMGRPKTVEHFGPGVTEYEYDDAGRVIETRVLLDDVGTPRWATTTFTYDDYASPPTMVETLPDPDGSGSTYTSATVTHTYDWVGNETSTTVPGAPGNRTTTTVYDGQNRVISVTTPDPDGGGGNPALTTTTTFELSSPAFSTVVTDPVGVATTTTLDLLGRPTKVQTGTMAPTWYEYNGIGKVKRVEVSASHAAPFISWVTHGFNAFGNPTKDTAPWWDDAASDFENVVTTYEYNAAGRLRTVYGPRGSLDAPDSVRDDLYYEYDKTGRLTLARYWTDATTSWDTNITYNDAGERLRITTELTPTTVQDRRWTYRQDGLVASYTEIHGAGVSGDPYVTTYDYDAGGRLKTATDERPCTITYVFDDLSRMTSWQGSNPCGPTGSVGGHQTYTYWPDSTQKTAKNEITSLWYESQFDAMGRPTKVLRNGVSTPPETEYVYNTLGQLLRVKAAGNTLTTEYAYATADGTGIYKGMLSSVDDPLFGTNVTYAYDAAGRVATRTDPGNIVWTRAYEEQTGRIDSQEIVKDPAGSQSILADFELDYDEAGNVLTRDQLVATTDSNEHRSGIWTYEYDAASRLTAAEGPDPSASAGLAKRWEYSYDAAGNRDAWTVEDQGNPGSVVTYDYANDLQGWPTALDVSGGSSSDANYTWDQAGNLTRIDVGGSATTNDVAFTVDAMGRQLGADLAASGGTGIIAYTLDAFGRVATRTEDGTATALVYSGTSEDLATSTTSGTTTKFSSTPGGPLAQQVGSNAARLYLRDLHSDVVGTIDTSATSPLSRTYYSPWGDAYTTQVTDLTFQGDRTDPDTAAVDMGARDYLPGLGRFTSRDLLFGDPARPMSLNQHAYTVGNPISSWDPTGLACLEGPCGGTVDGGESTEGGDGYSGSGTTDGNDTGSSGNDAAPMSVADLATALNLLSLLAFSSSSNSWTDTVVGGSSVDGQTSSLTQSGVFVGLGDVDASLWAALSADSAVPSSMPLSSRLSTLEEGTTTWSSIWSGPLGSRGGPGIKEDWKAGTATVGLALAAALMLGPRSRDDEPPLTLYRVWGGDSRKWGASWTNIDPRTLYDARGQLGLPDENHGERLTIATVNPGATYNVRASLPYRSEKYGRYLYGGAPEFVFYGLPTKFQLSEVETVDLNPPI